MLSDPQRPRQVRMAGGNGRRNGETTDGACRLPGYGAVRASVLARVASVQRVDDECARVQRARVGSPDRAQSRKGPCSIDQSLPRHS